MKTIMMVSGLMMALSMSAFAGSTAQAIYIDDSKNVSERHVSTSTSGGDSASGSTSSLTNVSSGTVTTRPSRTISYATGALTPNVGTATLSGSVTPAVTDSTTSVSSPASPRNPARIAE